MNGFRKWLLVVLTLVMLVGLMPVLSSEGAAESSWLWPVPSKTTITGGRYYQGTDHNGIDIPGASGASVVASKSGKVVVVYSGCKNHDAAGANGIGCDSCGCSPSHNYGTYNGRKVCNDGYGNGVIIDHLDGTFSHYAHLSSSCVTANQSVTQGQTIGYVGNSGAAAGAHLHFSLASGGQFRYFNNNPMHLGYSSGVNYLLEYCSHDSYYKTQSDGVCHLCHAWNPSFVTLVANCNTWLTLNGTEAKAIRPGPFNDCGEIRKLSSGQKVHAVEIVQNGRNSGRWYKLDSDDSGNSLIGYIYSDNVKETTAPAFKYKFFGLGQSHEYASFSVGTNNATLTGKLTVSGGATNADVTRVGVELYDSSLTLLASATDPSNTSHDPIWMWYDVSSELKYPLSPNTTYYYRCKAYIKEKWYYSDNYQPFTTLPDTSNPPAPSAPRVIPNGSYVNVDWGDVSGESGYDVYLVQSPWGWENILDSRHVEANVNRVSFSGVPEGYYSVFVVSRPNDNQTQSPWTGVTVSPSNRALASVDRGQDGVYSTGENVTMSVNVPCNSYYLLICHTPPGGESYIYWGDYVSSSQYTMTFPNEGYYSCTFFLDGVTDTAHESGWVGWSVVKPSYTITYNTNGGSGAPVAQTKTEGNVLTLSTAVPAREGYTFLGWAESGDAAAAQYQPGASFTRDADTTLYAVWKKEAVGGSCGENLTWTLDSEGMLTISGTGDMWDFEPANSSPSNCAPWTNYRGQIRKVVIDRGVTSVGNNAFEGCRLITSVTIPEGVARIGKRAFLSCYENLRSITIPETVASIGDYAFYSCWVLASVSFGNGLESIGDHAFDGCSRLKDVYYDGPERNWSSIFIGTHNDPLNNANHHFSITSPLDSFTISYNTNGGSGAPVAQTKTEGEALTLSAAIPTRDGYIFLGWAESSNATEAQYQPGASFTQDADTTLYAVWQANIYTVTFDPMGGTVSAMTKTVTYGGLYGELPTPIRSGYAFAGWYTAANGGAKVTSSVTVNSAKDHTLYALWEEVKSDALRLQAAHVEGVLKEGTHIRVPVSATQNPGYALGSVSVTWDPQALELVDVEYNDVLAPKNQSAAISNSGRYTVDFGDELSTADFTGAGVFFTLVFRVTGSAVEKQYPIGIGPFGGFSNCELASVEVQFTDGSITLEELKYILGDANGDGQVNNADRMILVRYLAGWDGYADRISNTDAVDINKDGNVNNADRMILVRYLAGWDGYAKYFE